MKTPVSQNMGAGRRYYETKEVGKIIRIVLKRNFPNTKFAVRCEFYSGGSSIRIYYDGTVPGAPVKEAVEALVKDYVNHDFDGMTDSSVQLDYWMMPDYSIVGIAHRGAMYNDDEINNKKPHKDAIHVLFGAGFVFVNDWGTPR